MTRHPSDWYTVCRMWKQKSVDEKRDVTQWERRADTPTRTTHAHKITSRDLTQGGLHRAIWSLAPAMMLEMGVLNVAQILDTYWVAQLGSAALAAVTISATVRWVVNSMANGLGSGGMAAVARRIGASDRDAASHAAAQTILLGFGASLVLGALGIGLAKPLLILLGADAEVLALGLAYLRVALGGVFTLILSFIINAMLRGAGEARLSLQVLVLSTATTVALEPALIIGLGPIPPLGVVGSAWAFVLGNGAGLAWQVFILLRGRARLRIELGDLRPDFHTMARITRIALPSAAQMTLRSSSRLAVMALVGFYGTFATAGYGVANRLLLFALIPCFGLGNAAGAIVGQNLGAEQPGRGERSAWWLTVYAGGYMAVASAILTLSAPALISAFDPTPEVVTLGTQCLRVVAWSEIAVAVGVVLARSFAGAGNTVPAMAVNLISLWGVEVSVALALSRWLGLGVTGIWWGRAIASLVNGALFVLWFRRGKWKHTVV
jgi:putative MATE family efflux protein